MSYPKHLFQHPGPYGSGVKSYAVAGVESEEREDALRERGWHETLEAALKASVLDHDGDGHSGGSVKQDAPGIPELRAEYTDLAGKKPFPGWGADLLRDKITTLRGAK